ncbi:uncharacterized protein BO96DRAFT_349771, partial [Aspergillus niger CBS 101883]|uniref:uncharacterized protein n=1 Tax=Aspergillus lacticoffeatus (strain CBS 101883) TaxID=1450533 RepID=UPI000D7F7B81
RPDGPSNAPIARRKKSVYNRSVLAAERVALRPVYVANLLPSRRMSIQSKAKRTGRSPDSERPVTWSVGIYHGVGEWENSPVGSGDVERKPECIHPREPG